MPVIRRRHCNRCGSAVDPNSTCLHCGETHGEARRRERRAISGRSTRDWARLREAAIDRDGRCLECGSTDDLTVHQRRTPALVLDDVLTLCRICCGTPSIRRRYRPDRAVH